MEKVLIILGSGKTEVVGYCRKHKYRLNLSELHNLESTTCWSGKDNKGKPLRVYLPRTINFLRKFKGEAEVIRLNGWRRSALFKLAYKTMEAKERGKAGLPCHEEIEEEIKRIGEF